MLKFILAAIFLTASVIPAFAADMPAAGTAAPAFSLPNQENKQVSLESLRGTWVVLYFYPKDFTSGCSLEAHNFEADSAQYLKKNAAIIGVSVDSVESHKNFCTKDGLNFTLLADEGHKVSALYGSTMGFGPMTVAARHTFLIDPQGIIRKTYPDVNPSTHSEEVLKDIDALQAADAKAAKQP